MKLFHRKRDYERRVKELENRVEELEKKIEEIGQEPAKRMGRKVQAGPLDHAFYFPDELAAAGLGDEA